MNYAKKQKNAKLDNWYTARKLGLKLNEWLEVRTGKRRLANDKLDVFNELTYNGKNEWINQDDEKQKIDEWFAPKSREDFQNLIEDFNVTQGDIATSIGVDASSINKTISKKEVNENVKAMLYYFFNDENNKKYGKKKTRNRLKTKKNKETNENVKEQIIEPKIENSNVSEEVKPNKYLEMLIKYKEAKEELERYKFLIDELRNQKSAISSLMTLSIGGVDNE